MRLYFEIIVTEIDKPDEDDVDIAGRYGLYYTENNENSRLLEDQVPKALDIFHENYGISDLDNFEIAVNPVLRSAHEIIEDMKLCASNEDIWKERD